MTSDSPRHERLLAVMSQIALVASITVFLTFCYRVVQHAMPRQATSGIPVERPDERRRVVHPTGFSLIRPEFWESAIVWDKADPDEGGIKLWSPPNVKPGATLVVAKLTTEPTLQGRLQTIRFQGQPARIAMTHRKSEFLEHPGQLTVELAFHRDDSYWLFRYFLDHDPPTIPKRMWEYMETFSPHVTRNPQSDDLGNLGSPRY